ncbi:uncharacterized protein LOC127001014 isoform X1 [Eriocheir sinensis]|uniref:uncharacterized protein LOC127001014 isoform X1 n=1 Tax=Eriocheir sinensis TaxID=95602 RepID=UPI0021C7D1B8|nr:uncharacterized protein LOC127001014 isoform X1 [Eriocheir sinensis]
MTQHKKMKKAKCWGCFDWLFARRARRSPPDDLDSFVEDTKHADAQEDAGEQGQASLSLVCLKNTAQPLPVVEEELPSDTRDADGVVGGGGEEAIVRRPQTLVITIHLVKREKVAKPVDETVAAKDWTVRRPQTLVITIHLVKREKVAKPVDETVAAKDWTVRRPQTLVITIHLVKREKVAKPVDETVAAKDWTQKETLDKRTETLREKIKEVCEDLPSEHRGTAGHAPSSVSKAVTDAPKKLLKSSFKKQDEAQNPAKKMVRFNFQNLNTFVKDRELYCGYDYFKYGFPLSMIRSELQKPKERTVKPQREPPKEAVNKLPEPQKTATEEPTDADNKHTGPQHLTGILKKGKAASTAHKCLRFDFQNLNTFVKDRELYCGHDYFKYGVPLSSIRSQLQKTKQRTVTPQQGPVKDAQSQSPNFTSRPHQQPVRSASNSLRGAPRRLGRTTQRSNDSFQQNSGRNAAQNYTNGRHSQHRQHNASSHVSPRYEPRYFYEGQTRPGTNSRSRRRVKGGAKPGDGDFL